MRETQSEQIREKGGAKLGAVIAESIKNDIIQMGWPVGRMLGTEADLIERYGVSRATLREAIRQIEGQGMAEMRCGIGGGLVINAPARSVAERTLATYLELIGVGFDEVQEARATLEGLAAELAARRLDDAGTEQLRRLMRAKQTVKTVSFATCMTFGMQLRTLIAELSGNPALVLLITTMDRFALDIVSPLMSRPASYQEQIRNQMQAQDAIIEAVLARNGDLAKKLSSDSFLVGAKYVSKILKRHGGVLSDRSYLVNGNAARGGASPRKLSQLIAIRIAGDIRDNRFEDGHRLGFEPDLIERYGVSRSVLREALRILELHGMTRTQRGNGGGIVAGKPNADYTVKSAVLYLRYTRITAASLYEVFEELEHIAVRLATHRSTDSGLAALHAIVARQGSRKDKAEKARATELFHYLIGDLSGNRALSLFLRVLVGTFMESEMFTLPPEAIVEIDRSHARLLKALEKHDEALASQTLAAHLKLAMNLRKKYYGEASRPSQLDARANLPRGMQKTKA